MRLGASTDGDVRQRKLNRPKDGCRKPPVGRNQDRVLRAAGDLFPRRGGLSRVRGNPHARFEGRRSQQCDLLTQHIAMRLQHADKTASTLPADTAARENARAVIVAEVLHWRIWNGKAAKVTIERIRQVMPVFQGEQGDRKRDPSSRRLWTARREIDRYLTGQGAGLVNDAERHRAGLRVGTSITEGTANFLVNRRRNKSQQMRWSRRGADLLLQGAGFNGKLGSS
jgi:hypothetical protein